MSTEARCGDTCDWRRGSSVLSLRHSLEPSELALCGVFLMPAREVEAFLATTRLPTDFMDGSTLFANAEGGKDHGVGDMHRMFDKSQELQQER